MALTRWIEARTHGRYLVEPPAGGEAAGAAGGAGAARHASTPLLVGFHGYGEDAERHLSQLGRIPAAARWMRCAVQALHPFYDLRHERVVASWMTRLGRDQAIEDNVRYVADVVAALRGEFGAGGPLVYAGFSQGVAMAYRAAALAGHATAGVLALAGDLPPELREGPLPGFPPLLIGRGTRDDWFTPEKLARDLETFRSRGVTVEACEFAGGHDWGAEFVTAASAFLDRVAPAHGR